MLVPAGVPANVTATFDDPNPNYVAFSVFDVTLGTPVLLLSPVKMAHVLGDVYTGQFTPQSGKLYLAFMGVYTDGTFASLDPSFATEQVGVPISPQYLSPPVQNVVGIVGCSSADAAPCPFTIFLGDSKTMYLRVANAALGMLPLDLTSCTELVVNLPNADGTIAQLKLSESQVSITPPANLGQFSAPISSEVSALLNVGELQNVDVTFTIAGKIFTVSFAKSLSVYEVA